MPELILPRMVLQGSVLMSLVCSLIAAMKAAQSFMVARPLSVQSPSAHTHKYLSCLVSHMPVLACLDSWAFMAGRAPTSSLNGCQH